MFSTIRRRTTMVAAVASLSLALAACGTDDTTATDDTAVEEETTEDTSDEEMDEEMTDEEMTDEEMESALEFEPVGDACSAISPDGEGSSEGMADDPVATAASNNPLLSTLVTAVSEAGLVDTLNGVEAATVFAPINDAFDAIPEEDLEALLADPEGDLTTILTTHVVGGQELLAEDLEAAGTATTLSEAELTFDFSGDTPTVTAGGSTANIICANVDTGNAVVHLIDAVLTPAS